MTKPIPTDTLSERETEARREATLKQLFATPHKPHKASREKKKVTR